LKKIIDLRIWKATKDDAYRIAEISSEVAKEGMVKELNSSELMKIFSSEKYYVAVAGLNKEVVGYAMSTYSWGKLHILDIAVDRSRRRMGIGKMLIKHLISHALEKGLPVVYCEVGAKNIPALNLFTSLGFKFKIFSPLVAGGFYGLYLPIRKS